MAGANLPAKKYTKTSPTQTRLSFECSGGATQFIDIGLALSAANRKFARAGVYYYVNSVEIYNDETGVVDFHTAPDTWVIKNAWNRGFQLFQKMNAMVAPPISNIGRPKYHDFKVYLDSRHKSTGSLLPSLHGINGAHTALTADEWKYSEFVSADDDGDANQEADNFFVHLLGGHVGNANDWTSVGLVKSYGESRSTIPQETPNDYPVVTTDPLMNVFDFSSEEQMNDIIEGLRDDNDRPPYSLVNYPGEATNSLHHVARIGTEVGVGRVGRASGFCAPFGLICIDPSGVTTPFRVVINLAVGTYHGVYAERA